jgi:hypothetical protein
MHQAAAAEAGLEEAVARAVKAGWEAEGWEAVG